MCSSIFAHFSLSLFLPFDRDFFFLHQTGETNPNQLNYSDIDLHLHKSNKLVDDNFVFIKRDENHTKLVDDFDKLVERYSNCFYRNENSAIDLCDGNVVSIK